MPALQPSLSFLRRGLPMLPRLALAALVGTLLAGTASAQEIKIGGTGGALATMQILADAYARTDKQTRITVLPSLGSGGGIKAVLAGAIQIAVSARPLKPEETSQGAEATEHARTPFVFAVSRKTKVDAITTKELADIYSGVKTQWPDGTPVRLVLRPKGDSDSEMVKGISPEVRQAKLLAEARPGMLFSVTDQESADNVEKLPGAFGPTTLAQIISEKRALKALRWNGIEPNAKTIADGSYPLFKPLFIVTSAKTPAAAQPFIAFVRSAAGRAILTQTGYAVN